ncbi:MAG: cryptochrome/photolyase family protein [Paucibacter sp.]|nr:cryptochrome/photolyase family protein [Roseateles sp.]
MAELRSLILVLGDQLDLEASAFDGFDPGCDAVWMAEVAQEATHVASSKPRLVMFLAAMRHFALALQAAGRPLHYTQLDADHNAGSLAAQLQADLARLRPRQLIMTAPGDWRVLQALKAAAMACGLALELRDDRHFFSTVRDFAAHAKGRKALRMEFFYREQRKRFDVLMDPQQEGAPLGGQWNFDAENRAAFDDAAGPGMLPPRSHFEPDALTREVIALVERRFAQHPGRLDSFAWPLTRPQALQALQQFVAERLPLFGRYQDAIWPGEPWLYHAHLSAALNLKLLNAREVVAAAVAAFEAGRAPLASVEGFVRQILGWREYVRGIYWTQMPDYLTRNALAADQDLPDFYWSGATEMACLRDAVTQTLTHGYANHIQRLMITGSYALMLGVRPQTVHAWYLAMYVDAVEWVELPNSLGMSQYADGGVMGSKPYIATGKYIDRMSPHCKGCRYDPAQRTGDKACPFTTLYWDFLMRHEPAMAKNPRMALQVKNLARLSDDERLAVRARADAIRRAEVGALSDAATTV